MKFSNRFDRRNNVPLKLVNKINFKRKKTFNLNNIKLCEKMNWPSHFWINEEGLINKDIMEIINLNKKSP